MSTTPNSIQGELQHLPIEQLHNYSHNPRKGNIPAIKNSLTHHGLFKPLLVNTGSQTGEEWAVLAGNHTLAAMRELNKQAADAAQDQPYTMVPCYIIDVDETQAAEIVLVDNKTSDEADYNNEALADLLDWLPDLDATGYEQADLDSLLDSLNTEEELPGEEAPDDNPYEDFITVRLQLPPHLAQQWLAHSMAFDSAEEALEHLLDHGALEE
ncbi:ParB N-terminal domain-containing protein [Corynebacterium macginleyi]|uniref:ParB N-terminal domain-containing protein n=1 Tax=Corynebacterium macginleyi TaxID=38290 RepID=UPI00190CDCEC|nr:ParB N-terminal domain-containing protein [Corynebacterium macginleyi]MBK4183158.1 ParB N-terminal domain-containing protein [Corynebacterium macginleyi]